MPIKITKAAIRTGRIPELDKANKIDIDQANQIINYLEQIPYKSYFRLKRYEPNNFIHMTYREVAKFLASEDKMFEIEALRLVLTMLYPKQYKL